MGPSSIFLQRLIYIVPSTLASQNALRLYIQLHKLFFRLLKWVSVFVHKELDSVWKKTLLRARQVGHLSSFRKER